MDAQTTQLPGSTSRRKAPRAQRLTNGDFTSIVTEAGGGGAAWRGLAVTRWTPDPTRDADGRWLYVRDLDSGEYWSAATQPVPWGFRRSSARFREGAADLEREQSGVRTRVEISVAPNADVELRRYSIANVSERPRRLELTTYSELVLNSAAGDAGHPAFSKLFVQTGHRVVAGTDALVAWRRLRSPDDQPMWVAHALVASDADGDASYETDRMRFLGRGRDASRPVALESDAPLSGTVGNVLDPVFSLRRTVTLQPGETSHLTDILAAAADESVLELLARFVDSARSDAATRVAEGDVEVTLEFEAGAEPPHTVQGTNARLTSGRDGDGQELLFFNGIGGFSTDGSEYVLRIPAGDDPTRLPPLPWANVIANPETGFIVSEAGATYTWSANSRENRLTPWLNDPVTDPHADALYLRDEDTGHVWSPTPGPIPGDAPYEVRHALGSTRFHTTNELLVQDVWMFVPTDDPVKIVRVRLANRGDRARRLSLYWYAQLVLGVLPHESTPNVTVDRDEITGALFATNPKRGEFSERVTFASVVAPPGDPSISFTADRAEFLGRRGSASAPSAVLTGSSLEGTTGAGTDLDPCAAYRVTIELAPGASTEIAFLLGEAEDEERVRAILGRFADANAVTFALEEAHAFWSRFTSGLRVETPSKALDVMLNRWLPYQNLSCRVWGRSAYYQSGGAFGFRDQLQDSSALLYLDPEITRAQIVLHASHQFIEGDVLHWWHPPLSKGIRTRFADDLLWLPYIASFYVRSTGDESVLDEPARFVAARLLEPGEDEAFLVPRDSGTSASVYEHCCRAIDRSLAVGAHGLPLMGVGDWNDGMNRVGREGRGESVWLGFFLYEILGDFLPYVDARGDHVRAERYRKHRTELRHALNTTDAGWDGEWYRRAYYDNGAPLGSKTSDECKIDVIAQAWAVLSGAAPADKAQRALDAMEQHLVSEREGIIRLLAPAFDKTPNDPGYIKGYLPGVRENGGQYTHGALWAVRALAEAGRSERAAKLLDMLNPVTHGSSAENIDVYKAEPYVIAADVYGVAPHVGRAGWTWYTGSAGWMYRVALESVLGFSLREGKEITLQPCIPADWPGFAVTYRHPDGRTTYELRVTRAASGANTSARASGGDHVRIGGGLVRIPLVSDGGAHRVEVSLGPDVGRRYAPSE